MECIAGKGHEFAEDAHAAGQFCVRCGLSSGETDGGALVVSGGGGGRDGPEGQRIDDFAHKGGNQFVGRAHTWTRGSRRSLAPLQIEQAGSVATPDDGRLKRQRAERARQARSANALMHAIREARLTPRVAAMVRSAFYAYEEAAPGLGLGSRRIRDVGTLARACCVVVGAEQGLSSAAVDDLRAQLGAAPGAARRAGMYAKLEAVRQVCRAVPGAVAQHEAPHERYLRACGQAVFGHRSSPALESVASRRAVGAQNERSLFPDGRPAILHRTPAVWTCDEAALLLDTWTPRAFEAVCEQLWKLAELFALDEGRSPLGLAGAVALWALRAMNVASFDRLRAHACRFGPLRTFIEQRVPGTRGAALAERLPELRQALGQVAQRLPAHGGSPILGPGVSPGDGGDWLRRVLIALFSSRPVDISQLLTRSEAPTQQSVSVSIPPSRLRSAAFREQLEAACASVAGGLPEDSPLERSVRLLIDRGGYSPSQVCELSALMLSRAVAEVLERTSGPPVSLDDYLCDSEELEQRRALLALKADPG